MSKKPRFPPSRRVGVVIFPDFQLLDVSGPITAFEIASRFVPNAYDIRLLASHAGQVHSSSGMALSADALSTTRGIDTLVVSGGNGARDALEDRSLVRMLARAPGRVRRIASVCSGAFLLAQAGLLDGKRATTHWRAAPALARMFPAIVVQPDCIYVRDGEIWTSAGITAGIDLALAMIAEDLGEDIATKVAREMVVPVKRPGGQAQHSALLELDRAGSRFANLNAWIREHLREDLSVQRLAGEAAMSPRNFARAYAAETGVTPAKAVERLRVETARAALAQGRSLQDIARATGFEDPERMRRAFVRLYGAPPAAVRRTLRRA